MYDIKTILKKRYGTSGQDIILDGADVITQKGYTLNSFQKPPEAPENQS